MGFIDKDRVAIWGWVSSQDLESKYGLCKNRIGAVDV